MFVWIVYIFYHQTTSILSHEIHDYDSEAVVIGDLIFILTNMVILAP